MGKLSLNFDQMIEDAAVVVERISKICVNLNPHFFGNGTLKIDNNDMTNSNELIVTFHCNNNFKIIGQSVLSCKDGIWDYPAPKCEEELHVETNWLSPFLGVIGFVVFIVVVATCRYCYVIHRDNNRRRSIGRLGTVHYKAANTN